MIHLAFEYSKSPPQIANKIYIISYTVVEPKYTTYYDVKTVLYHFKLNLKKWLTDDLIDKIGTVRLFCSFFC